MRGVLVWATKEPEPFLGMRGRMGVQRGMIYARRRTWDFAVVCRRVEVYYMEAVFEEVYARDKGFTLDTIFIQFVWMPVRRGDQDNAMRHQGLKKPVPR